jgi:hypothetical protein
MASGAEGRSKQDEQQRAAGKMKKHEHEKSEKSE